MLSISNPLSGDSCGNYYTGGGAEGYYANPLEKAGEWFGSAAEKLHVKGEIDPHTFQRLLSGFATKGRKALVQNAGHAKRQCGWDLTFSAPKSVSVLWAFASEPTRKIIEQCHDEAVKETLNFLEERAGITRRGKGGAIKERASLVFGLFTHFTSRALDPQIHTHALLANLAVRMDGTTGTLQSRDIFRMKMEGGGFYRSKLASGLERRLALQIEREERSFHVRGVPRELCDEFSQRRKAVVLSLAKKGREGAIAAKVAALDTRSKKVHLYGKKLFAHWQERAHAYGWNSEQAEKLVREGHSKRACEWQSFSYSSKRAEFLLEQRQQTKEKAQAKERGQKQSFAERQDSGRTANRRETNQQAKQDFYRVEWITLFPKAPFWSPFKNLRVPIFSFLLSDHQKWGDVHAKLKLHLAGFDLGGFRVQERRLFPHAPRWNPMHKFSLPALRFFQPKPFSEQVVQKQQKHHGLEREH